MKLLYFAWLRTRVGRAEEVLEKPEQVRDVASLFEWLKSRGRPYSELLQDLRVIRVAVNQEYVGLDHPVREGDEVALFPPVTGG